MLSAGDIRSGGVDDDSVLHRRAPQQHAKQHGVPVTQGNFDGPALSAYFNVRSDDKTFFLVAAGVRDNAFINNFCFAVNLGSGIFLAGMNAKADPFLAIHHEWFNHEGVQAGCSGTGIDFCLDCGKPEIGQ